jgi:hypothetical protein
MGAPTDFDLLSTVSVMFFGLFPQLFLGLMLGILLDVFVKFGLVMCNILLVILFLLDKVLALSLDLINLVFLFLNDLLIGLFQVLNPLFQKLIFFKQFLVFLLFTFHWPDLLG